MKKRHGITKEELVSGIKEKYKSPYEEAFTMMFIDNYLEWLTTSTRDFYNRKESFFEKNKPELVSEAFNLLKNIPMSELHRHKPSIWVKTIIWIIYDKRDKNRMSITRFSNCFDTSTTSIRNCERTLKELGICNL